MRKRLSIAVWLTALSSSPVLAQTAVPPPPIRIYGIVQSFGGQMLAVRTQTGETASVTVPPDSRIISIRLGNLGEIKAGDFVGSAAVAGTDGKLHAQEVHVFPESMRAAGEGHRPMGPDPNRTMTNGTVTLPQDRTMTDGTVNQINGSAQTRTLKISYKGGVQDIEVGPDVPIRYFVPGDTTLLKPGATVPVNAIQKDGGLVATNIQAEKDGVKPALP